MSHQETPAAHEDLYAAIMEDANRTGTFTFETEESYTDVSFEVEVPNKAKKNKLRRQMPSGLMDAVELPDDLDDFDELDMDDIDLSQSDLASLTWSEEATEIWLDIISEHFQHEYYGSTEIRQMFDALPEEYYISAGSYLMELGGDGGPVVGFHTE